MTDAERAAANNWVRWRRLSDGRILAVTERGFNSILTIGRGFDFYDDHW